LISPSVFEVFQDFEVGRATAGRRLSLPTPNSRDDERLSKFASAYRRAAPVLDASWQMAGAACLGALAGWFLDSKLGTAPWLLVAGSLLGSTAGLAIFIRAAMRMSKSGRKNGS
jgi:F0F1-type ATP synthase assembly protein I